jgi:glycosyltransferase involved in cell wall biosynthesis
METLRFLMISTHYPPYHLGGDAVMVDYLSRELARRGHEVHVLHSPSVYESLRGRGMPNHTAKFEGDPFVHTPPIRGGRLQLLMTLAFDSSAKSRKKAADLARRLEPDVVHWHNTKGFIGRPFVVPGAVSLYTAHDYYLVCPRSNLIRPDMSFCRKPKACMLCTLRWRKPPQIWRGGNKRVIHPDAGMTVLAPSEFLAERLRRDGIKVDHILRNFVPDIGSFSSAHRPRRDSIAYVGMLEPHKGPQSLLEAFANTRQRQHFKLHIIGEGSLRKRLVERAIQLGLSDRVSIPGFIPREDVKSILSDVAFLVVPSEWPENAPLTVLEAFSRGVPVLGSDNGGLPEILGPESGSTTFKEGDVAALGEALVSMWKGDKDLDAMSRKAREAYEMRFSPETHISQYLAIILKMI